MVSLPSRDEQLPSVHHQDSQNTKAAKHFFAKALAVPHFSTPRVITVDKNAAYPKAFKERKGSCQILANCGKVHTSTTSSSKTIARIKRLVKLGMGFFSFATAWRTDAAGMK